MIYDGLVYFVALMGKSFYNSPPVTHEVHIYTVVNIVFAVLWRTTNFSVQVRSVVFILSPCSLADRLRSSDGCVRCTIF